MNKWLFHQNGFTRTSLSAIVTRVGNFVEENVCIFSFRQGSRWIQSLIRALICPTQQIKYVNRKALSMFKALNNGCK